MKTILLKFSGPLQSWGTTSPFETRHTDNYPSKSAVIGMVAACLGYRRDETKKIQNLNDLDFGVRIDQVGELLRDYHTAKKYKKNGVFDRTYVTNRYYLEDAVFIVALGHEDDTLIDSIEEALKYPYFQPFMGRRALPLTADFFIESKHNNVINSLKDVEWKAASWYQKSKSNKLRAYVDADLLQDGSSRMRQDRVKSFSQKSREYGFRGEKRFEIIVNKQHNHDAFEAIGG